MAEENLPHRPQITVQAPSSSEVVTGSLPTASDDLLSHESSNSLSNDATQSEALSPGNVLLSPASSPLPSSGSAVPRTANESELSEAELRRLYDDEEIERFLGLFSDYVSEVVLPQAAPRQSPASSRTLGQQSSAKSSKVDVTEIAAPSASSSVVDNEFRDTFKASHPGPPDLPARPIPRNPEQSISETIAFNYILPCLPPARPRPDRFTIGRFRIAAQRLFLVTQAAYASFFRHLITLATWKDKRKSLMYCLLFWTLWYHDMLLPALFSRILFALLRRKILPYPTLQELRERRQEVAKAEELGDQLQTRLSTPSSGIMEAWRLFRVVAKSNKQKLKHQKEKLKGKEPMKSDSAISLLEPNEDTVLDEPNESQEDKDVKRDVLHLLSDFADFHERLKNIFLWRKPQSTLVYSAILTFLVFFTAWIPTKYIVKLAVFILGFLFWHVVPIIATLPPADRERLPPMFENSPTDAEYAMELISQRIARGEKIRPVAKRKPKNQKKHKNANKKSKLSVPTEVDGQHSQVTSDAEDAEVTSGERSASPEPETSPPPREIDWRKWGQKAASVKAWVDRKQENVNVTRQPGAAQDTAAETDAHTFLAYQKASPGLLVLTSSMLLYTPVTSPRPKLEVALTSMRGVKKIGIGAVPGISVKWERAREVQGTTSTEANAGTEIVEEKFQWVGGRDELFARLVGWGGRKWLKV